MDLINQQPIAGSGGGLTLLRSGDFDRFAPTPVILPIFAIAPKQTFGAKS